VSAIEPAKIMSRLIQLIHVHRGLGAEDSPVTRIRFLIIEPPWLPSAGKGSLRQGSSEPFASFEVRAVAAAKVNGRRFVVISVPEDGNPAVAEPVDDRFQNKHATTDWSAAELLVCICSGLDGTDPFDVNDPDLREMVEARGNTERMRGVRTRASNRLAKALEEHLP
jgi:hypothetical protein